MGVAVGFTGIGVAVGWTGMGVAVAVCTRLIAQTCW
jgi:hypothetical protein